MNIDHIEATLQQKYFTNPSQSTTEFELSSILIPKFQSYVDSTEFIGHTEVCINLPLDTMLEIVEEPEFKDLLFDQPAVVIPALEYAMHVIALRDAADPSEIIHCHCIVRIITPKPMHTIKELRASSIGKFICIKGTVIRASSIKPHLVSMNFQCAICNTVVTVNFHDGKYKQPKTCSMCKSKTFIPDRPTVHITERQRIRIQEVDEGEGRMPRSIECELVHELVNTCVPGDVVIVCGILKRNEVVQRRRNQDQTIYEPFLDVNYLENCRAEAGERDVTEFTDKDIELINTIKSQDNILRLLVHSLCPPIFGHYLVKMAMILVLFGGKRVHEGLKLRGDSHFLIVGDPGLGKSQMLKAVANVVPRGVYVSGSSTTKTGLTVSLHRSPGTTDFSLESGALVVADQGVCCIDEFDKMQKTEHAALLEAMEQQSISIAKAGICCTLPARTAVIAAANPIEGHFNKGRTVAENIHMPAPLLSRFDLIFVLVDNPDDATDRMLSSHIISLHSATGKRLDSRTFSTQRQTQPVSNKNFESQPNGVDKNDRIPLRDYLSDHSTESADPLPPKLFRKYLAYARAHVSPTLADDAKDELKDFYVELRQSYKEDDDTPVTTRQLESLIRLTEARAKLECREIATRNDAKDVIEIFKMASLTGLGGSSNAPVLDFRGGGGVRGGKAKMMKSLVSVLQNEARKKASAIFTKNELSELGKQLGVDDMMHLVDQLNQAGYLLKHVGGFKLAIGL